VLLLVQERLDSRKNFVGGERTRHSESPHFCPKPHRSIEKPTRSTQLVSSSCCPDSLLSLSFCCCLQVPMSSVSCVFLHGIFLSPCVLLLCADVGMCVTRYLTHWTRAIAFRNPRIIPVSEIKSVRLCQTHTGYLDDIRLAVHRCRC
jgi:hypothetical protein